MTSRVQYIQKGLDDTVEVMDVDIDSMMASLGQHLTEAANGDLPPEQVAHVLAHLEEAWKPLGSSVGEVWKRVMPKTVSPKLVEEIGLWVDKVR